MSAKPNKAADFLKAMRQGELAEEAAATAAAAHRSAGVAACSTGCPSCSSG